MSIEWTQTSAAPKWGQPRPLAPSQPQAYAAQPQAYAAPAPYRQQPQPQQQYAAPAGYAPPRGYAPPQPYAPQAPQPAPYLGAMQPAPVASAANPLVVASLGPRLGAWILDAILMLIVLYPLMLISDLALGISARTEAGDLGSGVMLLEGMRYTAMYALVFAYWAGFSAVFKGQSPGKRAVGLRFVRTDGREASGALGVRRAAATVLPCFLLVMPFVFIGAGATSYVFFLIGSAVAWLYPFVDYTFSPLRGVGRQTLHDRMGRTVVVKAGYGLPVPTAQPAAIAGRARTNATWVPALLSVLFITLMVVLVVIGLSVASDLANYDSTALVQAAGVTTA